jgi:hypothetical protein
MEKLLATNDRRRRMIRLKLVDYYLMLAGSASLAARKIVANFSCSKK